MINITQLLINLALSITTLHSMNIPLSDTLIGAPINRIIIALSNSYFKTRGLNHRIANIDLNIKRLNQEFKDANYDAQILILQKLNEKQYDRRILIQQRLDTYNLINTLRSYIIDALNNHEPYDDQLLRDVIAISGDVDLLQILEMLT